MFRFGIVCLILCWQSAAGIPITEYEYFEAESELRLHIVPTTWSDAAVRCQLDGGVLASPTTKDMAQTMLNAMELHKLTSVFIGVTDVFSGRGFKGFKHFKSLNGNNLADSLEWAAGEPNDADDTEGCLVMTAEGTIADVSCARVLPYFCRKITQKCPSKKNPSDIYNFYHYFTDTNDNAGVPSTVAQQCDGNGYEYEDRTGSCYKFHRAADTWRRALATCNSEGGHLTVINSGTESAVLRELYERNNYTVITGTSNPYYAYVGFRKWYDGEWATIHGETLAEAGFEEWSPGEPNGLSIENCGTIYWDGLLNDAPCNVLFPYICEKAPKQKGSRDHSVIKM